MEQQDIMPNRILRDWTDSKRFEKISPEAERLFVRLLMKADDYGRYHAEPRLVKAGCFPLLETLRANTVELWIKEVHVSQLVFCYEVSDRAYLAIPRFRQRMKMSKPKFPAPLGEKDDWLPPDPDGNDFRELPGTSRNFPPESETYSETETVQNIAAHKPHGKSIVSDKHKSVNGFEEIVKTKPVEMAVSEGPKRRTRGAEKPPPDKGDYVITTPIQAIVAAYKLKRGVSLEDRTWDRVYFPRCAKSAQALLRVFDSEQEKAIRCVVSVGDHFESQGLDWTIETVVKRAFDYKMGRLGK